MLSYDFSMKLHRFTLVLTWSTVMLALVMASSSLQAQTPESKLSQKLTQKDRAFVMKSLKDSADSRERFVTAVAGLSEAQWKFEWAPALRAALKNQDKSARRSAADALGQTMSGTKKTVTALRAALKDEDEDVCRSAAKALRRIQAK